MMMMMMTEIREPGVVLTARVLASQAEAIVDR